LNRGDVARGFGWNIAFSFVNKAFFPLVGIVIARILGPEEMGIYVTILTILNVTEIFRDAGLGVTFIADRSAEDHEGTYMTLSIAFGLAIGGLLFVFRGSLGELFGMPQLNWGLAMAALAVGMNGLATVPANKLQKLARFRDAGLADTAATLLSYGVALPLVFSGYGFVGLVWQLVSRTVLFLAFTCALARPRPPVWNSGEGKRILRLSSAAMLNNLAYTVYTLGDKALIAKLFGKSAAGYYGVAYNVAVKPLDFITFPLGRTLLVAFSQASDDRARLAQVFCRSMAAVLLISVPIYGFFAVFSEAIIVGLYSERFAGAVTPFALLSGYLFCRSFGNLSGNAVFALGKPGLNVASWAPGYLVAAVGFLLMGASRSLDSAALWITLGAAAAYGANTAAAFWLLRPADRDLERIGTALLIGSASVLAMVVADQAPWSVWVRLPIGLAAGAATQLALIGKAYGTGWASAFSKAGLKSIWSAM
jgi:O-antigen/teichoic acid export membrane protein